jgi:hypothetical protein
VGVEGGGAAGVAVSTGVKAAVGEGAGDGVLPVVTDAAGDGVTITEASLVLSSAVAKPSAAASTARATPIAIAANSQGLRLIRDLP